MFFTNICGDCVVIFSRTDVEKRRPHFGYYPTHLEMTSSVRNPFVLIEVHESTRIVDRPAAIGGVANPSFICCLSECAAIFNNVHVLWWKCAVVHLPDLFFSLIQLTLMDLISGCSLLGKRKSKHTFCKHWVKHALGLGVIIRCPTSRIFSLVNCLRILFWTFVNC